MFEPFIWMFQVKDFKKHFLLLCLLALVSYGLAVALRFIPIELVRIILTGTFCIFPGLFISGYFWNLVEEVINRDWDLALSNIYDGNVKEYYKIQLPELDFVQNIWRGVAAAVAMVLLWIPFAALLMLGVMYNAFVSLPQCAAVVYPLFLLCFAPALLWNYAHRSSIVAVWNLRKAIYLMGNYTLRYVLNTATIVLITLGSFLIDAFAGNLVKITASNGDVWGFLFLIPILIKNIYLIFVYAYLLGTIAPASES